jgi:alpha-glucosidase
MSLPLNRFSVRLLLLLTAVCISAAVLPLPAMAQARIVLETVANVQPLKDGVQIQVGSGQLRITALRDDILRVRVAPGATLPEDASWAVLPASRTHSVDVQALPDPAVGFRTSTLEVRVERSPLRLIVSDLAGNVLCADALGQPTEFSLGGFSVHKEMAVDEHFYGLGDKAGTFDRREQAFTLWNTDIGPQESIDPLYKSIPFFLGIREGRSYGLFLDNTWRTWFDFGKASRNAYSFGSEGGPLDYYFLYGPTPKHVVESYAYLTGTPPLPPLWSLGFQQSRYSYSPESQVREVAGRLRVGVDGRPSIELGIDPCLCLLSDRMRIGVTNFNQDRN